MRKIISVLVVIAMLLSACGTVQNSTEEQSSQQETHSSEDVSETTSETETVIETEQHSETERVTESEVETQIPSETETTTETESETETSESDTEIPSEQPSEEPEEPEYTYTEMSKVMYAKSSVNIRDLPSTEGNKLGGLYENDEVKVTGKCNETGWYRIEYRGKVGYVSGNYLVDEKVLEYIVDMNRDGICTEKEMQDFEKRYDEELNLSDRKLLLAGHYKVVHIHDDYYALSVPWSFEKDDRLIAFEEGMQLLEEGLFEMGLASAGGGGGIIDYERYGVGCDVKPIAITTDYDIHGDVITSGCIWPTIAEEKYGCDWFEMMGIVGNAVDKVIEYEFVEKPKNHDRAECGCGETVYTHVITFEEIIEVLENQ